MKIDRKYLKIAPGAAVIALVPLLVFLARSPVLIVTEQAFIALYGEKRIRREASRSSFALFRQVKTVVLANDSGDDLVRFAIDDVSARPFCVLFPYRFARPARLYRNYNPRAKVVLLEGRFNEDEADFAAGGFEGCFFYKTDIEGDFYTAGLAAAAIDGGKNGKTAVFLEARIFRQAREAFLRGLNDGKNSPQAQFFTSFFDFSEISDLSCVVLAGVGLEYTEGILGVPIILFSWLDPNLAPAGVVLLVDDSPWSQVVRAVKMASSGREKGLIGSKFILTKK